MKERLREGEIEVTGVSCHTNYVATCLLKGGGGR